MDTLETILTTAVKLAQDGLTEASPISIPSAISATHKHNSKWTGRKELDGPFSSEDEENGLDLMVFAKCMKRRRKHAHADASEHSNSPMPEQSLMYPTVSLHEPEAAAVSHSEMGAAGQPIREHTTTGPDKHFPFLIYLKQCPDLTFETQFKLSRSTVQSLLHMLRPSLDKLIVPSSIDAEHSLLIALWLLISTENALNVAERFNVQPICCQLAYDNVCKSMATQSSKFVQWPDAKGVASTVIAFDRIAIPGIIGVIGCTRFLEPAPRKGVSLQAATDHTGAFVNTELFVGVGRPNAEVFTSSRLRESLVANQMLMPPSCHLAGDQSYPLNRFLMVPYKGSDVNAATRHTFNERLSAATSIIDSAFARLRERFGKLKECGQPVQGVLGDLRRFVNTAVMLHNFCIQQKDAYWLDGTEGSLQDDTAEDVCSDEGVQSNVFNKRDLLALRLANKN